MRCIQREYPNKLDHVLPDIDSLRSPRELHPTFFGCFDWHSAVHGHWLLVKLLDTFDLPESPQIRALLNQQLTNENLAVEAAYFVQSGTETFERPYGWAWLLKLATELHIQQSADAERWKQALVPLEEAVVDRYRSWLPRLTYPVRCGVHSNTAFGLYFPLEYSRVTQNLELENLILETTVRLFGRDMNWNADFEPSGEDFLSPSLMEASLMGSVLPPDAFASWLDQFLPRLEAFRSLLHPIQSVDRNDPKSGHLDGLNLSRAWCMGLIQSELPVGHQYRLMLEQSIRDHADYGLKHIESGNYMGDHWLASFAMLVVSTT